MAGSGSRTLKLSILADVDQLKKSLSTADNDVKTSASKIGDFSKKVGAAFVVAGAAAAAYAATLLVDGVKSAIEDQAAQEKLATTLQNVTNATDAQIKATEDYISKTALANGITDDKLRPSLDRLVRSTKDVEEAQRLQTLALDIAAGTGKDLQAVSEALAKAHDGNLGALKKLGVGIDENIIKSKDFDAATAALAATFEGQASSQAETFQGKMARLSVAFDEAKETVGSYVLDALTPLVSTFVDKGIPAIQDVAKNLGETLGPAFAQIFKFVRDELLPILIKWWKFLYDEVIPAIGSVVGPILLGLKNAFDTIKKAISDNSEELQPFYDFLKKVWEFIKEYLAPILGGAFKKALEIIGDLIGGLIDSFAFFVGIIDKVFNGLKKIIDIIKNNPIVSAIGGLFGSDGSKGLKAGTGSAANPPAFDTPQFGAASSLLPNAGALMSPILAALDLETFTKLLGFANKTGIVPGNVFMPSADYEAGLLKALDLMRKQSSQNATSTSAPANNITVNMGVVGDPESAARTIVQILNDSYYRGTNGAGNLQLA